MTYVINPSLFGSAAATLLLDETGLGSAHGAYSVARKLRDAYGGSAIRVRRSSDSTEQDIGFSNDVLDTASLESFCSGTNGFITTLYDQSGNGNNVTQSTAGSQAQIVSAGTTITDGGKPAAQLAAGNYWTYAGGSSTYSIVSFMGVFNANATAGDNNTKFAVTISNNGSAPPGLRAGKFNNASFENYWGGTKSSSTTAALSASANTSQMMGVAIINDTAISWYENNNSEVTGSSASWSESNDGIGICARVAGPGANPFKDGYFQEGVVWKSDIEAYVSTIKSNVNAFYSIY